MTKDAALRRMIGRALKREAAENLLTGQQLIDGQWHTLERAGHARRKRRITHLRQTLEATMFWAVIALAGFAFIAIVVAIL